MVPLSPCCIAGTGTGFIVTRTASPWATTGQSGYVYKNDLKEASGNLEGKAFNSPEEAMAWIDSHRGKPIPVYDKEGETKVGEFISGR